MCLAQGPQRNDAGEARTRGPSVSSQALYHRATALPILGSYMNQDLFTSLLGAKPLKGLRADGAIIFNPTKIGIRHIKIPSVHTFCMHIIKEPLDLG